MFDLDKYASSLKRCGILTAAAAMIASCSPSSNRISSPRLRGAAAAKPFPNAANNTTTKPVNDGSALALATVAPPPPTIRKAGGFILTEGYGIEAGLDSQKSRITFSSGKDEQLGNPKGLIEVLNIPYCTEPQPSIELSTLKRCVSRASWDALEKDSIARNKILSTPWAPRKIFKQCTASVTIDGHDFGGALESGSTTGIQRVRVWTAEHCYQASYVKNVHMFFSAAEVLDGQTAANKYVSVPLHTVDGLEFSKAIVGKNGDGSATDPNRDRKLFILRSMDGRSSDSYDKSVIGGCLRRDSVEASNPNSPFKQSKFVDCFTTADLATFKASIDLSRLSDNPFKESVSKRPLAELRRALLQDVVAKEKNRYVALQSAGSPLVQGVLSALRTSADFFGFAELFVSQMDGLGHSRRVEAMRYEQKSFPFNTLDDLGIFAEYFRAYQYDVSNVNTFELAFKLARGLGTRTVDLGCSILSVIPGLPICPPFVMSPQQTVDLESRYYQPVKDLKTYLKLMLAKFYSSAANPQMSDDHPLKIQPADDEVAVSAKLGAIWTRLSFESALMRKEPFEEVSAYNTIGKAFQQILNITCPSTEFANQLFPVFLNRENASGRKVFGQFGILGPGMLKIMPIVGEDVGSISGFNTAACGGRLSIVKSLGSFVSRGGVSLPLESTVAIDVDDKLLCLPSSANITNECSEEDRRQAALNYMSRRVIYKFEGAQENTANVVGPTDSGTLWTFLGFPAFALTSHNGELINGVVFDQIPDINTIDPDQAAPATDAQGNPVGTCN